MANTSSLTVNNPAPVSKLVAPRGFVLLNGYSVPWETLEVTNTRYSAAGTFRVTLPVSALPKSIPLPTLLTSSPLSVQINAGTPLQTIASNATPGDVPMIILGSADEVVYMPKSTYIEISGRDYISKFIENKINQKNVTPSAQNPVDLGNILDNPSSVVITQLANARGLTPVVTQTTAPIGRFFQSQYSFLSSQVTEWDLITFLARNEGFDVYVLGNNLYFQPKADSTPYQITIGVPYYTTSAGFPVSNVVDITFKRNYRLAKNIVVNVSSWNVKDKMQYTAVATLNHTVTLPQDTQIYNFVFPNLTQDQCSKKAENLLLEISQHEMEATVNMPADNLINEHSVLSVKGTGTIFDQNYYVKSVTREMTYQGGFFMTIEAKNQTPYTITTTTSN